jgi:DNA-binding transcriptional ArsR family regulator
MEDCDIIERLAALAHPTRLRVFRLLVMAGPQGVPSGEIARRLGAPATTMSSHLAVLARTGLIEAARDSRIVRYRLAPSEVQALMTALMADCCGGHPDLCAPGLAIEGAQASQRQRKGRRVSSA